MTSQSEKADGFLALHRKGEPLLLPNPWDEGSARLLASLGFQALATTSSGHAASLGRLDGAVSRDEALDHARRIAAATDLPVSADFEHCFADDPGGVAETARRAMETGLAGFSIEDYGHGADRQAYELSLAAERVAAVVEEAHRGEARLVVTARADNFIRGVTDLDDTLDRLLAYQEAGADCLYAPGLADREDIARVVAAVDRPVNVLARPNGPSVAQLAELGVARISVGGAFAYTAYGALLQAGRELAERGTYGYSEVAKVGAEAVRTNFSR